MTGKEDRQVIGETSDIHRTMYGWILIVGAIFSVGFAMIHPQITAHELGDVLKQMAAGALFNGWVHGILMTLYLVLVSGFVGFSRSIGIDKPIVSLAMVAYAFGAVAMMSAAVINGFALGLFAERYAAIRPDQFNSVASSLNALGSLSGTWAVVGAVATSMAILLWSAELVKLHNAWRMIGLAGIVIGMATSVLLVAGLLILNVHGFLLLVLSQALWTVAVGTQMVRAGRNQSI